MSQFTNKIVVITGGSSGIGLAAAQEFERKGAIVVVTGRNTDTLAAAAQVLNKEPFQNNFSKEHRLTILPLWQIRQ